MTRNKQQIRGQMKLFLASLDLKQRHERSLAACALLSGTREFKSAEMVMLFLSMKSEVETSTLAVRAWQEGKSIAVPRVDWQTNRMEPVEIRSLDVGVAETQAGVREPVEGNSVPLSMIDLVVVPGLAFDRKGLRVGRGRGFYDRFLAQQDFRGTRVGLCFHEQLEADGIPCEDHDMPMDLVITDREVIRCPRTANPRVI